MQERTNFKVIFNTVILLLLFNVMLNAQEVWSEIWWDTQLNFFEVNTQICGDTLVDGLNYESVLYGIRKFGRRKEGDKVYLRNFLNDTGESLFYDYSLQLGDSIDTKIWDDPELTYVVVQESVITINKEDRRRIVLSEVEQGYVDIWIEGIGSIVNGYLYPTLNPMSATVGPVFSCYYNEEANYFYHKDPNSFPVVECGIDSTKTYCTTTSNSNLIQLNDIHVYPNPSQLNITIDLGSNFAKGYQASIYNYNGYKMISQKLLNDSSIIDISVLDSGIYILNITDRKGIVFFRKIISKI